MVLEAPKKFETAAGELNLMELEAGAITSEKASKEGGGGRATLSSHMQWRLWRKKTRKIQQKYDRGRSGCTQDAIKMA